MSEPAESPPAPEGRGSERMACTHPPLHRFAQDLPQGEELGSQSTVLNSASSGSITDY